MSLSFIKRNVPIMPRLIPNGPSRKVSPKVQDGLLYAIAANSSSISDHSVVIKSLLEAKNYNEATSVLKQNGASVPSEPSLPVQEWLGYGYTPFGFLPDEASTREQLFDIPLNFDTVNYRGSKYAKYASVEFNGIDRGSISSIDVSTMEDISKSISSSVSGGASFALFGGEFTSTFSMQVSKHWEYMFSRIQLSHNAYRLRLPALAEMKKRLKPAIKQQLAQALSSEAAFHYFLDNYGTHFVNGVMVGAYCSIYTAYSKSSYKSKLEMQNSLKAHYTAINGSVSSEIKSEFSKTSSKACTSIVSCGGGLIPNRPEDLAMNAWQSKAADNPAWMGFAEGGSPQQSGLVPMYLLAETSLQSRAQQWWKNYLLNHNWITDVGKALSDLNVNGDSSSASRGMTNTRANNKYTLLPDNNAPIDMNMKAGGWYIYIGALYNNFGLSYTNCITDIQTIRGKNAVAPPGWTKLPLDLNRGAGGDYIYLCIERGNLEKTPIRNVSIVALDKMHSADIYNGWDVVKDASGENSDLNRRAGGKYIYLLVNRK